MQRQGYVFANHSVLFAFLVLAAAVLATLRLHAQAQEHQRQAGNVCRGFVALPTGIAVMSGMPVSHAPGGAHTPHAATHAGGVMPPAMEHSHMKPMGGQASNALSPLLRYTTDGGETLSPIHTLSQAIQAYAPDVAVSPTGAFMVVWHEEDWPAIKTVLQPIRLDERHEACLRVWSHGLRDT